MLVPQLSGLLNVKKEELPNFFVLHPYSQQVVAYPDLQDDFKKHSPEQILLWGRRTILYMDVEIWENDIKHLEEIDAETLTEEDKTGLEHAKKMLASATEELNIVIEKLDDIEAKIAANENPFGARMTEIELE